MGIVATVCHVGGGLISALSTVISPALMVSFWILFLTYEYTQYWEKEDWPTEECVEFMIGFSIGIVILIVARIMGLI